MKFENHFIPLSNLSLLLILLISASANTTSAQTTFSDEIRVTGPMNDIRCVVSSDLDGDGDKDVVAASFGDNEIFWLRNPGDQVNFGLHITISQEVNGAEAVFCVDIDNDGDIDVLSASYYDDKIAWYENLDGYGSFGPQQVIASDVNGASFVFSTDLDGDGDNDVVSAAYHGDEITWYENVDGNGVFELHQVLSTSADGAESVFCADLDGDGDNDVLAACDLDDKIVWFENTDGLGTFGTEQIISLDADGARSVFSADLNGDGDFDVLSALEDDSSIVWYSNSDGLGDFVFAELIYDDAIGANSVYSSDLDGDGDNDVLSASSDDNTIAWFENTDSFGNFGPISYLSSEISGVNFVYSDDLDGDGDNDVLASSNHPDFSHGTDMINWFENTNGQGFFSEPKRLIPEVDGASSVFCADLDGDGDEDIVSALSNDNKIVWYENVDGLGTFNNQRIISDVAFGARCVFSTDIDGDGDFDVVAASYDADKIAWYENMDGLGNQWSQRVITYDAEGAKSVYCSDIDGDGDSDVLSASYLDHSIVWYENTDGLGDFGTGQLIDDLWGAMSVFSVDLDGDGDLDALAAGNYLEYVGPWWQEEYNSAVGWYENTDGLGTFGPRNYINSNSLAGANAVYSADLDGDGDNDVIASYFPMFFMRLPELNGIWWYENQDGAGDFGEGEQIDGGYWGGSGIVSSDIDNDGDNDIAGNIFGQFGSQLAWYKNTDGLGTFSLEPYICSSVNGISFAYIDGNGSLDLITSIGTKISWYRNELPVASLDVTANPWEDPVIIEPDGGNFRWDVSVENDGDLLMIFDAWTALILPDSSTFEPLDVYTGFGLLPGYDIAASPNQLVPPWAPNGIYTYIARVGDFETDEVYAEDSFLFTKLPLPGAAVANMTGNDGWILTDFLEIDETSAEETESALPSDYFVENPYPNPFNPTTTINIGLPESSFLKINVFNILGQQVDVLVNNQVTAGYHSFILDGSNLTSGVYFIHTNVSGKLDEIRKVVLMK